MNAKRSSVVIDASATVCPPLDQVCLFALFDDFHLCLTGRLSRQVPPCVVTANLKNYLQKASSLRLLLGFGCNMRRWKRGVGGERGQKHDVVRVERFDLVTKRTVYGLAYVEIPPFIDHGVNYILGKKKGT